MKPTVVLVIALCLTHGIHCHLFGDSGLFSGASNSVGDLFGGGLKAGSSLVGGAGKVIGDAVGKGVNTASGIVDGAGKAIGDVVEGGVQAAGGLVGGAGKAISDLFGSKDSKINKNDPCSRDVQADYQAAQSNFYKRLYASLAARNGNHFIFSPYSIWLTLSALAEGADPSVQAQIFNALYLPQEKCLRQSFYNLALSVEGPGRDANLQKRRSIIFDQSLDVNPNWAKYVKESGLLDVASAPIKFYPKETAQRLKEFLGLRSDIVWQGNSLLLDTLDYQGLWTTAFGDSKPYLAPFYDEFGKVSLVPMYRTKRRVRLAQVPFMSTKVLELPVGANGRYTMLLLVGNDNNIFKNAIDVVLGAIYNVFTLLELSLVPIDIAVPKFIISSEIDINPALEDLGIDWFWKNPAASNFASPAAVPGSYIERAYVNIDSNGVESSSGGLLPGLIDLASNTASDVASTVAGRNFVADRPFMFALFDTATHTCIFTGAYSKPQAW